MTRPLIAGLGLPLSTPKQTSIEERPLCAPEQTDELRYRSKGAQNRTLGVFYGDEFALFNLQEAFNLRSRERPSVTGDVVSGCGDRI